MTEDGEGTATDAGRTPPAAAPPTVTPSIRATYDEFELAGRTVGTVSDPENDDAWVQSDVTVDVRP